MYFSLVRLDCCRSRGVLFLRWTALAALGHMYPPTISATPVPPTRAITDSGASTRQVDIHASIRPVTISAPDISTHFLSLPDQHVQQLGNIYRSGHR